MRLAAPVFASLVVAFLAGCSTRSISPVFPEQTAALSGTVHGGQQPVAGATIQLYAASTSVDQGPAIPLLRSPVLSDLNGNFSITGNYTCPSSSSLVYLTATGGNPGLSTATNNSALAMMAALGNCGALSASTNILINELTTVGSAAALYPFMTSPSTLGASSATQNQLAVDFQSVPVYTDIANGLVPGPALPSGYYASSTEIATLADIVASCINSPGGKAGDGSPCGNLFNLARSGNGNTTAPTDTISAVLNILTRPTANVASIYALSPGSGAPFQPTLTAPPTDWTLPILPIPASPVISPAAGTYSGTQAVTITDSVPGAVIYFTLDGSTPTTSSSRYTFGASLISLSVSATVKTFAMTGGRLSSPVVTSAFTITPAPSSLFVVGGSGQSARIGTAFATPLQVRVLDQNQLPFPGAVVSFTLPPTGAGAGLPASCTTDANGLCSVQATANQATGTYSAGASLGTLSASFTLTNTGAHSYLVAVSTDTTTGVAGNCIDQASVTQASNAQCSLRDALTAAAATATSSLPTTVTFSQTAATVIPLSHGTLTLPAYTLLQGATSGSGSGLTNIITVDGSSSGTILTQNSGVVQSAINNLTFTHGNAPSLGGAISMNGTLTIANSTFTANQAGSSGGAITNAGGTLAISGSTFNNNMAQSAYGGAIDNYSNGILQISNSTFVGNYAASDGGAIYTNGTATIVNTTLTGNSSPYGAAIYNNNPNPLTVRNSILTADSGSDECGGIYCAPLWAYVQFCRSHTKPCGPELHHDLLHRQP